jgi:hypothetical protein
METTLVGLLDARIIGQRILKEPLPRQAVSIPAALDEYKDGTWHPSGEPNGGKCFHGVYIPYNSRFPEGIAPYCSLCRPYEIVAKEDAAYKTHEDYRA